MRFVPTGAAARGQTPPGTPTIAERAEAARLRGDKQFDPGVPCQRGHVSMRATSSRACLACTNELSRERYAAANADRPSKPRPDLAARWEAAKAAGDQTFDPGRPCVHGHTALRWTNNGICVECKRARDNSYNAAHKEDHLRRARESVARRPNEVKEYHARYQREHAEELRRRALELYHANPERYRPAKRKWAREHAAYYQAAKHLRRAREVGARTGSRKAVLAFIAWSRKVPSVPCYWCGKRTKPGKRHIDHIIPLAKGGADAAENLCVACPTCNMRKQAKLPEEFSGQAELRFA